VTSSKHIAPTSDDSVMELRKDLGLEDYNSLAFYLVQLFNNDFEVRSTVVAKMISERMNLKDAFDMASDGEEPIFESQQPTGKDLGETVVDVALEAFQKLYEE